MYLDHWGLNKPPFSNVTDPEMYFDMHQSVDQAVSEILFAMGEESDVFAMVIGGRGLGKTMTLRIILDSLVHENFRIAYLSQPSLPVPGLLAEIVTQLRGKPCKETDVETLMGALRSCVTDAREAGRMVLIFLDESALHGGIEIDGLRQLAGLQAEHAGQLSVIVGGQPDLADRLKDPHHADVLQSVSIYCRIDGIDSPFTMRSYVQHRLKAAGHEHGGLFTDDALAVIWEASTDGSPKLINKLCHLALRAGADQNKMVIDQEVVGPLAKRFMRTYLHLLNVGADWASDVTA